MSRANNQAFPMSTTDESPDYHGMTLREYYAGLAMQGMLASQGHGGDAIIAELEKADPAKVEDDA